MNATVYIQQENEEQWKAIKNKSKWVNDKLELERKGVPGKDVLKKLKEATDHSLLAEPSYDEFKRREKLRKRDELHRAQLASSAKDTYMVDDTPPALSGFEKACCLSTSKRCQHWSWNEDRYVNSLSGREVAVE